MPETRATEIGALCDQRRWKRTHLIRELRLVARSQDVVLPDDDSLKRMIRGWISGDHGLSPLYAELLSAVFGVPFVAGKHGGGDAGGGAPGDVRHDALRERLESSSAVDRELVRLLEEQTQSYRLLDRRLGARRLLAQTETHLSNLLELLTYSLPGGCRADLAAATAAAAALASWQALDLGDAGRAWQLGETARSAARESENPSILAFVTAQQGYVLLDADRPGDALAVVQHAQAGAARRVPGLLSAWLWAAEAEALAAGREERAARCALDAAAGHLPGSPGDEGLPFVVLDDVHFLRWRGHCLARLGAAEAIDDLASAIERLDPSFMRAAAGLHCDLAFALSARGRHTEARREAQKADELARRTASARQQRRIRSVLAAAGKNAAR